MMKNFFVLWLSLSFYLTTSAQSIFAPRPKLSASVLQYLWQIDHQLNGQPAPLPEYVYQMDAWQKIYVSTFLQVAEDFDDRILDQYGVRIGTRAGDIRTVSMEK